VQCLAWTKDGKTLVSGSFDYSIRIWNTKTWKQIVVLNEHTSSSFVNALAISPNGRVLASASQDSTARLWNLDNGQPISSLLQHAHAVICMSFSVDGKVLATGCQDCNVYTWDVAAIIREAGLGDLLSDPKADKLALHSDATQRPVQRRPPAYQMPRGFFDGVPPDGSQFYAQSHSHTFSEPQGSTLLRRLFHRSPSNAHDTSLSSPLHWARNLLTRRGQSSQGTELQGRSQVVEVPYAKGKRRNACAREKRKRLLPLKNPTAGSSRPPQPNVTQPSPQPQATVSSSSTTPDTGDATAVTTSIPSPPHVTIRHPGRWTRFWLFIGCISHEYTNDRC
jgi:WD40 repeat protein